MARSIDVPVISVSEDMAIIAVYVGDEKHPLEPIPRLLEPGQPGAADARALHATGSTRSSAALSALEVEDLVTLRDVVTVLQRTEMVRRIAEEIEADIVELGVDGRLVRLQLEELMGGVDDDRRLVMRDYFHEEADWHLDEAHGRAGRPRAPRSCSTSRRWPRRCTCPGGTADLDASVQPRGYRLLATIPRLPESVIDRIVDRFGNLQKIMRATIDDLDDVDGVGEHPGPGHQGGPVPPGRVEHPRPLQLTPPRRPSWRSTRRTCGMRITLPSGTPAELARPDGPADPGPGASSPTSAGLRPLFDDLVRPAGRRATAGRCARSSRGPGASDLDARGAAGGRRHASTTSGCWATRWPRPTPPGSSRWRSSASAWAACTPSRPRAPGASTGRWRSTG